MLAVGAGNVAQDKRLCHITDPSEGDWPVRHAIETPATAGTSSQSGMLACCVLRIQCRPAVIGSYATATQLQGPIVHQLLSSDLAMPTHAMVVLLTCTE